MMQITSLFFCHSFVCMCVYVYACMNVCMYICMYVYIYYVCMYVCVYRGREGEFSCREKEEVETVCLCGGAHTVINEIEAARFRV